jgi:hypothetical protein
VPSIASFGHLYKVLRSKSFKHLCELPEEDGRPFSFHERMAHHTVNVTDEESFAMIKGMLEEFLPLFTSVHFNICSDETFDLGKGRSKEAADKLGTDRLYIDFVKHLCELVISHGKRPMFWGDIVLSFPEAIKELPEETICLNWDYSTNVQDTNVKKLHELGANQYLCPGVHGWLHLMNRNDYAYKNISKMCRLAHQYKALGVLNTDWGDYGHIHHPEFSMIGLIYGAAFSWNPDIPDEGTINRAISALEFADKKERAADILRSIAMQECLTWSNFVQFSEEARYRIFNMGEEELFKRIDLQHAMECNERLEEGCSCLYELMAAVDCGYRQKIYPYLVMAKGQQLLNTIGATIGKYRFGIDNCAAGEPAKLAGELEKWLYDYKKLWRTVSRESELYRIEEVYFWYADYLRSL